MARCRARLTYANVMATAAVFIALGGSSYAAIKVTGKNVENSSLTGKDIKRSSLTGAHVRDGSLFAADFGAGQIPAGPQGAKGDPGPKGDKGDPCLSSDPACRGADGADGIDGTDGIDGIDGTDGTDGIDGPPGAPGTARAYGVVYVLSGASPTFNPSAMRKNFDSVTRTATGVYCLEIAAAAGVNPGTSPPVVSVDWAGTNSPEGNTLAVSNGSCGTNGVRVRTYRWNAAGNSAPADNVGFAVAVP